MEEVEVTSILDGFYEALMFRIQEKAPGIKHIDQYYGQYDNPQVDKNGDPIDLPFVRPAVFIEFPGELPMEPLGLRRKVSTFIFTAHLVLDEHGDVSKRTSDRIRKRAYEQNALIDEVVKALEGFRGDLAVKFKHFGSISFVGLRPYNRIDGKIAHLMGFKVRLIYDAAKKFYTKLADLVPPINTTDELEGLVTAIPIPPEEV